MAYNFVGASSQNLNANAGSVINGATQATLAFWANRSASTIQVCAFSELANNRFFANAFNDGNLYSASENGSVAQSTVSLSGLTGWIHLCLVFDGSLTGSINRHKVYRNGSLLSPSILGTVPSALSSLFTIFRIGRQAQASQNTTGDLSEVAIWTAALDASEVASLSKGFPPKRIRPQSLRIYTPLIRQVQELRDALTFTNTGGATPAAHSRSYG